METPRPQNLWWILATFIIAFMLDAMPLPHVLALGRPEWVYMVLLYWAVSLPYRVGIVVGWIIGLLLDVMQGTVLGMQAGVLSLTAYLGLMLSNRLLIFPFLQQCFVVALIMAVNIGLLHNLQGMVGVVSQGYLYLLPAATSALVWPFLYLVLNDGKRRFRVQ